MRTNSKGLTGAIRHILSDGEWHDVADLAWETRHLIPSELAERACRASRRSVAYKVYKGRALVVARNLVPMVQRGELQVGRDGRGKIASVRLEVAT